MSVDAIVVFYIFLVGSVFGSFLNVVLYRMRSGRSLLGRSSCGSCNTQLTPIDLIPVFSFFFLNGRCRKCGSKISAQYPIVEALTGTLFVLSFMHATTYVTFLGYLILSCLSVLIAVYDMRHTVIPAVWNYAFAIVSFCIHIPNFILGIERPVDILADGILLFIIFWVIWKGSKGTIIGYGDVLLLFGIGLLVGTFPALVAVWVACIVGSIYGLSLMYMSHIQKHAGTHITLQSKIPFGPFLLFGTIVVIAYETPIFEFVLSLSQ